MKILESILLATLFYSCNTQTPSTNSIPEQKPKKETCVLDQDTFSFKGIKLGSNIKEITRKYKLALYGAKNSKSNLREYLVDNCAEITLFDAKLTTLRISTLFDKIYRIDFEIVDDDVFDTFVDRYNGDRCVEYSSDYGKPLKSLTIVGRRIGMIATWENIMFNINNPDDQSTHRHFVLEVADYILAQQAVAIQNKEYRQKEQQKKNDI